MFAYRYNEQGFYIGKEKTFIDPLESKKAGKDIFSLPAECTFLAPKDDKDGYIQKWNGSAWEYVENHIGKTGYVDGKMFEVKEYGPLPAGWSETPPAPTVDELFARLRAARDARLAATDYVFVADYPASPELLEKMRDYRQQLRDLPAKAGAPWTDETIPWPVKPQM